ncbi:MAG: VWA domain-containing protein [Variibacter sp.]
MGRSSFRKNDKGNVVPFFALAVIPLIGSVGVALDYSRAAMARTEMRSALDASGLMLSKEALTLTKAQLKKAAKKYFKSNFQRNDTNDIGITATFSSKQGAYTLKLAAAGSLETTFTRILGIDSVDIASTSEVTWWDRKLEVALVLDNTGSMASNSKMTELKKATHNLLNTLKGAAKKPDDVKVAIVPFNTVVNLGTSYASKPWFDWTANAVDPAAWGGCVQDRAQPEDTKDTGPAAGRLETLFPASACNIGSSGLLTSIVPLTTDWTALHDKVDAMTPDGTTNITIGLEWGWHALTANAPLDQAAAPSPALDKIVILMTDGENTQNRWSSSAADIDDRLKLACANVNAAGIRLYTIRVLDGNAPLLQSCASNPTMYYDVQNAAQLNDVFSLIANNLANLRISQ